MKGCAKSGWEGLWELCKTACVRLVRGGVGDYMKVRVILVREGNG